MFGTSKEESAKRAARWMTPSRLTAIELLGTPPNAPLEISLSLHLHRAEVCRRLGRSAEAQADLQIAKQMQEKLQARQAADQRAQEEVRARIICNSHLKSIELAKVMWADEKKKEAGSQVTESDLKPFFGDDGKMPTCPSGGTYNLNKTGEQPTCSIPGHVLDNL
jgi:hypothetical protein